MAYRVVDTQARRVVLENTATARVEQPLRYAVYQGDASTLTLSRDERALFDAERVPDAEQDLLRDLDVRLAQYALLGRGGVRAMLYMAALTAKPLGI